MTDKEQRYVVKADESSDYWVVPVEQIEAFEHWNYGSGPDTVEGGADAPDGCWCCGGWPHDITFTDPRSR